MEQEPLFKRQRKEPAWHAGFVDPNKVRAISTKGFVHGDDDDGGGAATERQQQQPASCSPSTDGIDGYDAGMDGGGGGMGVGGGGWEEQPQVLDVLALDHNRVEVVLLHQGRRYRGVVERTGLPPGVGVPIPLTKEELESIGVTPWHGENPSNMCALCNTPLECTPVVGITDNKEGVFLKVRVTANWTARVHLQCAVWCPECVEDPYQPGYYHHMGPAVRRGRALRCKSCKERGATVGCFQEGCPAVYHLTCAVNAGCAFDEATLEVWCPQHLR